MCPSATSVEEGKLDSLADLVLDLSSVIVERSSLLPALLPVSAPVPDGHYSHPGLAQAQDNTHQVWPQQTCNR